MLPKGLKTANFCLMEDQTTSPPSPHLCTFLVTPPGPPPSPHLEPDYMWNEALVGQAQGAVANIPLPDEAPNLAEMEALELEILEAQENVFAVDEHWLE